MNPPLKAPNTERERKEWESAVCRELMALRVLESQTIKRDQKSNGVILDVKDKPGGVGGGGAEVVASPLNMVYRGEHNNGLDYRAQDLVSVHGGGNTGLWIATQPIAAGAGEPGSAAGWLKIGESLADSIWI